MQRPGLFLVELALEMCECPVFLLDELVVLGEDVPHLIAVHALVLAELDLEFPGLLPEERALARQQLLPALGLLELVHQQLDVPLDLREFGDPASELLVLLREGLEVEGAEVLSEFCHQLLINLILNSLFPALHYN